MTPSFKPQKSVLVYLGLSTASLSANKTKQDIHTKHLNMGIQIIAFPLSY